MSDPKERFIAGLGRAAEAVSGTTALPDFEAWWKTFIAHYLPHGIEEHSAAKFAWQAVSTALASQLSDLEAAKNDALTLANLREAEIERLRETLALTHGALVLTINASYNMTRTYNDALERAEAACQAALAQSPEPKR